MLSETRGTPGRSPVPGVIPDPITTPRQQRVHRSHRPRHASGTSLPPRRQPPETRAQRFRRKAHRGRLHGYAIVAVALVAFLIALAASNTTHVKVNWVFGSSHVSLVWLVLFAAILGWLLGLLTSARLRWRTRAPHPGEAQS